MNELEKPIRQVQRRLWFQHMLGSLVWTWGAGFLLVALYLGLERFGVVPSTWRVRDWVGFALAGGVGLVLSILLSAWRSPTRVDAAVAIDRAFHLNERLSTALTLDETVRSSPAGQALIADAIRQVGKIEVHSKFVPRCPRLAWVPLIPAALAFALLFVKPILPNRAEAKPADPAERERLVKQSKALSKKIASQRKEMVKGQFAEAEKLLAEIQKAADDLSKAPPTRKDKALVELNKLTDAVKERQKKLGSSDQMNRQLQQLKQMASLGPADDFARDLAKGDFQNAIQDLKKLQEKLASGKMSQAEKKTLEDQLKNVANQLQKMANLEDRKKQLEEARKNGGLSDQQYQREMEKLADQAQGMKQLAKMASQLQAASEQLEQGNAQQAAKALGMTQEQLAQMASQMQELESLEGALADLQEAKNGMMGGEGNQFGESMANMMGNNFSNQRGQGQGGRGRGEGDRPEAPDATSTYSTKVDQQVGKGKAILKGLGPIGKVVKGQSVLEVQGEMATSEGLSAEALSNQKVPRSVERHIRGYFDQINKRGNP